MSEPCKPTGNRKLMAMLAAMLLITLGYGGTLWIAYLSKVDPSMFAANFLTFAGFISGVLGLFVGSNAAVHIKGKDLTG